MNISNILKQKKITQDLEERIKQSIDATSAYLRTVNGDDEAFQAFGGLQMPLENHESE